MDDGSCRCFFVLPCNSAAAWRPSTFACRSRVTLIGWGIVRSGDGFGIACWTARRADAGTPRIGPGRIEDVGSPAKPLTWRVLVRDAPRRHAGCATTPVRAQVDCARPILTPVPEPFRWLLLQRLLTVRREHSKAPPRCLTMRPGRLRCRVLPWPMLRRQSLLQGV